MIQPGQVVSVQLRDDVYRGRVIEQNARRVKVQVGGNPRLCRRANPQRVVSVSKEAIVRRA